jgi:hypothetical protein
MEGEQSLSFNAFAKTAKIGPGKFLSGRKGPQAVPADSAVAACHALNVMR